ncbi:MAG: hypothetical protein WKG01_02485 [Kofleriaceae bacterium]
MQATDTTAPSPLAREIYRQLVRHLRTNHQSITYGELAAAVGAKIPTHPRSSKLHAALGELTAVCRDRDLPLLPAMVWRAGLRRPSAGYYQIAHPRARTDDSRLASWEREHDRVIREAARLPSAL